MATAFLQDGVGYEDMAKLQDLHEGSILDNIKQRYEKDRIYTYIGSILCAINPYKTIPGIYGDDVMQVYNKKHIGECPPHIFAIANDCYYSMWKKGENQCVLISGESGAGKTESTKFILNYLSELSQFAMIGREQEVRSGVRVEDAILQSSPIMEAFGNAKTVYNNNSSRFGKFIQLQFTQSGSICGGKIRDYLLEKNRVVGQNPQERNYHIFYCLLAGADPKMKGELRLGDISKYHYLNQSGCTWDDTLDDRGNYQLIKDAMKVMEFTDENVHDVFHILGAILHIGNIKFITAGGAQVENMNAVEIAASLLHVDEYQLMDALTQKTRTLRGEVISTPLDLDQAADSRDSLAMKLYAQCFKWIIQKINNRIKGFGTYCSIGVLDIFGFENFEVNRFEQFNINYANEKLQEYFNKHIFSLEQHEYAAEGLEWVDIAYQDNGECLDLVEKKLGILSLIDEESRFPKGTDVTMLEKLHDTHNKNVFYVKPRVTDKRFGIRHYAGEVFYTTTGFLEKNRDTFRDDILHLMKESRSDFIYDLFENVAESQQSGGGRGKDTRKKATVSAQFKDSLHSLMSALNNCNPYFVRCVKPNTEKAPTKFQPQVVLNQLRYSGMLETIKIRRAGYPVRRIYTDFIARYKSLFSKEQLKTMTSSDDSKQKCSVLLLQYDGTRKQWQLGKNKAFLKETLENTLETERERMLGVKADLIKAAFKGHMQRKQYLRTRAKIIVVQNVVRMHQRRLAFIRIKNAAIVMQKYERARKARNYLAYLKEEKRKEEERVREEQRRREEEEQRELERLKQEAKLKEMEILQKKLEVEARQRQEEEETKKKQDEELRLAEIERAREIEKQKMIEGEEARRKAEEERLIREKEEMRKQKEDDLLREQEDQERALEEEVARREAELERMRQARLAEAEKDIMQDFDQSIAMLEQDLPEDVSEMDEDEDDDTISRKSEETQYFESFLQMKAGGMMNTWRKRWFVLRDETLMWFRTKQEALKSGWLQKKGGGTGTLSRRNWKKRFFVLKDTILSYYESDSDGAKLLGKIDIKSALQIIDSSVGRENSLELITDQRTYHVVAETADECSEWYSILTRVKNANEFELRQMRDEEANPKNAIGSLDVGLIDSVVPVNVVAKPNAFAIITAERVISLVGSTAEEMNNWLTALTQYHKGQRTYRKEEVILSGWMTKENTTGLARAGGSRKKRYFVLTQHSLDYYRSIECLQKMGAIAINSLCSVTEPDEKTHKEEGLYSDIHIVNDAPNDYYRNGINNENENPTYENMPMSHSLTNGSSGRKTSRVPTLIRTRKKSKSSGPEGCWKITLHSRRTSLNLYSASNEEAWRWTNAIQDVIDTKPPLETPFQTLIKEIREVGQAGDLKALERIYQLNPILRSTPHPIKAPLLPLPYGHISSSPDKGYSTLQDEAVKIFPALQGSLDNVPDPLPLIQTILQTAHDLKPLRDEVYCQVVKQTTQVLDPDGHNNLRNWQLIACMAATFLPSRNILRYVRFHIKRQMDMYPDTQMSKYGAFALDALKRTRTREFPPSRQEIIAILGRREMNATVHCHGEGSCQITINSSTTAGQVVHTLIKGMGLEKCHNRFALYERSGQVEKAIDDRTVIADVLTKFERYVARNLSDRGKPWQLFFKLFCFLDTKNVEQDSIEYMFMYEQSVEDVLRNLFPASHDKLVHLAALRMESLKGDYLEGDWIRDLSMVYPVERFKNANKKEENDFAGFPSLSRSRKEGVISGTLRGLGEKTLKRLQKSASDESILDSVYADDISATTSAVIEKWKTLKHLSPDQAQEAFMNIIRQWQYYGARLFEVECRDTRYPSGLWLAVGVDMVAIHKQGMASPIEEIPYEKILSFGAPILNEYKIVVEGRRDELTFETTQVFEIAKLMKAYINEIVKKRQQLEDS
ncbi:unconventional myosin-X isoform X3 [Strongylocentrotus purpuratus]|uniref:Unconventional myosin-X n=1 Tax=Strongylocentrotus purpuratus TaxID=7668 RepID=A0A7M7P4C6_STRPU|nr:unconventional myosin-X isoform X3 [Strongylocentrotus purpuratus]